MKKSSGVTSGLPDGQTAPATMSQGVWVKADVVEGKLTVHPVSTMERPAYNAYLARHFSGLDDGFFFRVTRDRIGTCPCSGVFAWQDSSATYEVYSSLANLLFTGTLLDPESSSRSLTSSIDSDSEVEEAADSA